MTATAVPVHRPDWPGQLARVAGALAAAYLLVLAIVGAWHSGGRITGNADPIMASPARLEPLRGQIEREPDALVIRAPDALGVAVVAVRIEGFAASDYRRVTWRIGTTVPPPTTLLILWRTRESPNRTFSRRLEWVAPGIAAAELAPEDGWRGSIVGLALATRGPITQPLPLLGMTLTSASAVSEIRAVLREWSTFFPFRGNSFSLPFDEERTHVLSLVAATALAEVFAGLGYVYFARRRRASVDARVLWGIFLAGWLVLDLRWQLNLWKQLGTTAEQFAGKTIDAKHRSEDDHPIYELMQRLRAVLPPPPVRILFLSSNQTLRTRGGYFLLPHNVNFMSTETPPFDAVHPGDCVLLLFYDRLGYDAAQKRLVWPDGRSKPVAELFAAADGPKLLCVRQGP